MATEKIYPLVKKMDEEEKVDAGVLQALFDNGVSWKLNLIGVQWPLFAACNLPIILIAISILAALHILQSGCCASE